MLNKLMLQGRFTGTPELRSTLDGINVVRFTIASQRDRANKDGEREADFIQCVAWRGTAEFICRYFAKGQCAVIEGALRSRKWVEGDITRYGVEVEVSNIHFCGGRQTDDVYPYGQKGSPRVLVPEGEKEKHRSGLEFSEQENDGGAGCDDAVEVSEIHFCGGKNENAERRMQNAENGARDDEAAHNGGWSAPGSNAFSLGDDDVSF